MRWIRSLTVVIVLLLLMLALPITAQDDDDTSPVTDTFIFYDDEVTDTITDEGIFDLYRFNGAVGEVVVIDVRARDGLAPLIGLLGPNRELVAVSEDGVLNGEITLEYTLEADGEYIINVTRVGRDRGTTTGTYDLRLRRANNSTVQVNPLQDVVWRCGLNEVTTAATIDFSQNATESLRFVVYGLDGFDPVIRLELDIQNGFEQCQEDGLSLIGDTLTLPDSTTLAIDEDNNEFTAELGVNASGSTNRIIATIGSVDGAAGRYVLVISGRLLQNAGNIDIMEFRIGPLAAQSTDMTVYMIATGRNRIDPYIDVLLNNDFDVPAYFCDDAGLRECEDVLSFDGASINGENIAITGDRFDAGVILSPGGIEPSYLEFSSRAESATGTYALVIIGELPPRESDSSDDE